MTTSRNLARHERELLLFLIETNAPLYGALADRWLDQINSCKVREIDSSLFLAVCHDQATEDSGCDAYTLRRELIGIDEGVAVLAYVQIMKTPTDDLIDIFSIDRLDGKPLKHYPSPGPELMIMELGKRIGGADWRNVYKESDFPFPSQRP
ncbi:hypothetical protein [Paraburkholderia solisilvae]|uniref:Uncharacterized protein n=2 Tax=Paraburkholderia solisilvae TaxID=624376 RepID=A0A6J5DEV8_9BURK|nr:hypothetical protein LMG29739_01586 [Paraburkholderia solisilvae]